MRLIDGAIQPMLLANYILERKDNFVKVLEKGDNDFLFAMLMDYFDAQPTAYDPDKVVQRLVELRKAEQDRPDDCDEDGCGDGEQIYDDGRSQGRFEAFGKAIEVVKGGGVDVN